MCILKLTGLGLIGIIPSFDTESAFVLKLALPHLTLSNKGQRSLFCTNSNIAGYNQLFFSVFQISCRFMISNSTNFLKCTEETCKYLLVVNLVFMYCFPFFPATSL